MGNKQVILRAIIQRLKYRRCNHLRQEKISFGDEKKTYTKSFERHISEHSQVMIPDNFSRISGVGWNTVKRIEQSYLTKHYSKPRLKQVRYIAIDEFVMQKSHKYMTVVMDLETHRVLFVGEGKSAETLKPFRKMLRGQRYKL